MVKRIIYEFKSYTPKAEKIQLFGGLSVKPDTASPTLSIKVTTLDGQEKEFDIPKGYWDNIQTFINTLEL